MKKLSTKKNEMKERPSPLGIPYREKAKLKETDRVSCEILLDPRARVRTRDARVREAVSYREAGLAADTVIEILGAPNTSANRGIWAGYCRHFGPENIIERAYEYASYARQGEVKNAVTAFQAWLNNNYGRCPWRRRHGGRK